MTFTKTYSLEDVDIKALYKKQQIGMLASVSYQIDNSPKTLKEILNKKRRIAGTLSFIQFDFDPFCCFGSCPNIPLPFFDISIVTINEYKKLAQMNIENVQILYNDKPVSVDDVVNEYVYQYTAEIIIPWRAIEKEEDHTGQIYNEYTGEWSWL